MVIVRTPPSDLGAERALLGCMIQDSRAIEVALGLCSAEDFYLQAHGTVFNAIRDMYTAGSPVEVASLSIMMRALDCGAGLISELVMSAPVSAKTEYYANIVADLSAKRAIISGASSVVSSLYSGGEVEEAAASLSELSMRSVNKSLSDTPEKYMPSIMGTLEKMWDGQREKFIPTGYRDFDEQVGGFEVGGVTLIGGEAKTGKTTFLLHAAASMASRSRPVGFFEFDMPSEDLPKRWICSQTGYNWRRLHTHDKSVLDPEAVNKCARMWEAFPFYLSGQDGVGTDFDAVMLMARRWKRVYGIQALFIDSIQSLRFSSVKGLEGEALVAAQMDAMVRLAVTLDIAVIAISEYSNNQEVSAAFRFKGSGRLRYGSTLGLTLERPENPESGFKSDYLLINSAWERNQGRVRFVLKGGFDCYNLYRPETFPEWVVKRSKR